MDLNAKMSKSKKKKLKKREKRNQQLMEEAMKHAMEAKVIFTQNIRSSVVDPDRTQNLTYQSPHSIPWIKKNLNLSTISTYDANFIQNTGWE